MIRALRDNIPTVTNNDGGIPVSNAGLELDRYLPEAVGNKNEALGTLLKRVCGASTPGIYRAAYDRWLQRLTGLSSVSPTQSTVAMAEFQVKGRLIVGLGAEGVRETSITLLHAYGVPVIPGPALKGLARHFAERAIAKSAPGHDLAPGGIVHETLFGNTNDASFLTFFDAWYVPGSAENDQPLRPDVITAHHPEYYARCGDDAVPWDLDDPNPVPFVSATGRYLVAVSGPSRDWTAFALKLLTRALTEWGVGAKTSSGYGRLLRISSLAQNVRALQSSRVKSEIHGYFELWKRLPDGAERTALAIAIIEKLQQVNALKAWSRKPWVQELIAFTEPQSRENEG